jgi:hypothetical protein
MKRKVTIEIVSIYRTHMNSPYHVTIKYGPDDNQYVTITEGDKFDIPDNAMIYDEEEDKQGNGH